MLTDRRCPPSCNTLPASGGAGPQVRVAADVVAGTFVRVFASLVARVPCESVHERGPGRRYPGHALRGSSPRAAAAHSRPQPTGPRCRLLKPPGKRSHLACAKGGCALKRPCPPAAAVRPILIARALLGDTGSHACTLYVKGCWLHQTPIQPTPWTRASVSRCGCAAMSPHWPWRAKSAGLSWRRPRCGRAVDLAGVCPLSVRPLVSLEPRRAGPASPGPFEEVMLGTAAVAAAAVRRQASIGQAILDDHPATVLHLLHAGDGRGQMVAL